MRQSIVLSSLLSLVSVSFYLHASGLPTGAASEQTPLNTDSGIVLRVPAAATDNRLQDMPAKVCTPFCVNPLALNEDVDTVDELAVIQFMEASQTGGNGVLVDARSPNWHQRGTIPGSQNIPASVFERTADDAELTAVLENLGAQPRHDVSVLRRTFEILGFLGGKMKTANWDFSQAQALVLWCNDPWSGESPRAIKALLSLGYPAEKLHYYRGGLQTWESLGLTTVTPAANQLAINQ